MRIAAISLPCSLLAPQTHLIAHDINPHPTRRVLVDLPLKPRLNRLHHRLVPITAHEADSHTLGAEATGTSHTMQVRVSGLSERIGVRAARVGGGVRHVVVDGDVDALNVDAAAEDVGTDADAVLEVLEVLVALDAVIRRALAMPPPRTFRIVVVTTALGDDLPLVLAHTAVHRRSRKVALQQQLHQLVGAHRTLDEDDDLIVCQLVQ